ncbi:MAG: SUMF1/EgtB/PvdO family nonheme iron enzyme [Candidatus Competibacter sp.]
MTDDTNALPRGFNLHRYQIEKVLGAGGFGITYRAIHEALENQVAIKEYFPAEWAYRDHNGTTVRANAQGQIPARSGEPACYDWGLQRFLDEAKILVQINHPCVVRVRDYFTANGSAYIVMEYEDGESLSSLLQRGGILPESELRHLLDDVMPALDAVHGQGYLHRDLKPSNLYIRSSDTRVMLIDFGAARQALGRRTRSVTSVVTPGYSPIEQYVTVGEDYGPWTDIYALGAVLYRCITGAPPIEAPGRVLKDPVQPAVECGAGLYSRGLLKVADRALAVRPEERFQTVAEMREALAQADRSNDQADFSKAPQLRSDFLELAPLNGAARAPQSQPSRPLTLPHEQDPWSEASRVERRSKPRSDGAGSADSNPFQRSDSSVPSAKLSNWSFSNFDSQSPASPPDGFQGANPRDSLPLLDEQIWDKLGDSAPRPPPQASGGVGSAAAPSPNSGLQPSLLNRPPQSVVEHLRKASANRIGRGAPSALATGLPDGAPDSPSPREDAGRAPDSAEAVSSTSEPGLDAISYGSHTRINWRWIMLMVFAISGLSGTGLLGYEYYQAQQSERLRDEAALRQAQQKQQEEESARLAREQAQNTEKEIARYLEQARGAIAVRDWTAAKGNLERAAVLSPDHPEVAAVRAELLATQQPGTRSKLQTDPKTGMQLAWVDGGCFTMGSPSNERDRGGDESPHQVCVKGFWIGSTEVTNAQFRRFKPDHNSGAYQGRPLNRDAQPAVNVSWDNAKAFAEWLSWEAGTGKRFRLPTEAEWERAARTGTATRYYWGNDIDPRYANFSDRNDPSGASVGSLDDGQAVTAPVASYQPNNLGVYDMAGNVWEWTCSEYAQDYGDSEQNCSDKRGNEGLRAVRGGSWNSGPGELRAAKRLARKPDYRDAMTGFRVIMEE